MRIGISACLLGEAVRYDGGHRRDAFITGTLAGWVELVPVCPEVELGLGVPREPIRLVREAGGIRLRGVHSGTHHTAAMRRLARRRARELASFDLAGFIVKRRSPSCGMERVAIHGRRGARERSGRGLFTATLMERLPLLPIAEDEHLHDPRRRESYFVRVFGYRRLRALFDRRWRPGDLERFHAAEQQLLLAHHPAARRELDRLVAAARRIPRRELAARYQQAFMQALARPAPVGRHVKVLRRVERRLAPALAAGARRELAAAIADFEHRLVPLVVPLTLLRHHARLLAVEDLLRQTYLDPHPRELMLRYHA